MRAVWIFGIFPIIILPVCGISPAQEDLVLSANGTETNLQKYEEIVILNGRIKLENASIERFFLPELTKIKCNSRPCISIRNNAKLKSIWLPKLEEIDTNDARAHIPMIALQGDALELTNDEIERLRYLTSNSLTIEDLKNITSVDEPTIGNIPLYADIVLLFACVALLLSYFCQLIVLAITLFSGRQYKRQESSMINEMLQVRQVSIDAKTTRYLVEDFQKKNPSKNFTEALQAVKKNISNMPSIPTRSSRMALNEVIVNKKKEKPA
ncbi:unnamed protein product [Cylicocyclus nassatus]|uniref:Receptor L-domain domain-containing protein n=1 Tax=Cylicocyclus nassatus TaxID=53992 RepID=A0AA36DP43_CYLNA|nr:unnamed protein product [Cylicocyclus nassatus]